VIGTGIRAAGARYLAKTLQRPTTKSAVLTDRFRLPICPGASHHPRSLSTGTVIYRILYHLCPLVCYIFIISKRLVHVQGLYMIICYGYGGYVL
jgi:hypothetical protein